MKPGDVTALSCPRCGIAHRLIVKRSRKTKSLFYGCQRCRYIQSLPETIWMREKGQKGLFDGKSELTVPTSFETAEANENTIDE